MKPTDQLYSQLRSALIRRNENEAIDILTQIIQADPADKDAVRQLEALSSKKTKTAAPVVARAEVPLSVAAKAVSPLTKELYVQFRTACLAHDEEAAFAVMSEIIRRDPADMNATQQHEEIGQRLAAKLATELPAVLESRNATLIAKVVQRMKEYAAEEYLMGLPEYEEACAVYKNHTQKTAQTAIATQFENLDTVEEPRERHQTATEIERYAAEHEVRLSAEQRKKLASAHEDWELHQVNERELAVYKTLNNQLSSIKAKLEAGTPPRAFIKPLDDIRVQAAGLQSEKKSGLLIQDVDKLRKTCIAQDKKIRSRFVRKMMCWIFLLGLSASAGTLGWYVFDTVEERTDALKNVAQSRQIAEMVDELHRNRYLEHLYRNISLEYKRAHATVAAIAQEYEANVEKLRQFEEWLEARYKDITLDTLEENVRYLRSFDKLRSNMETRFSYAEAQSLKDREQKLLHKINEELKSQVINSLEDDMAKSETLDLEQLTANYKIYQKYLRVIDFSNAEKSALDASFQDAVERTLLRREADVDEMIRQARRYRSRLNISEALINRLNGLKEEKIRFENLPKQLSKCRTLAEYLQTVSTCQSSISLISNACSLESLNQYKEKLSGMAMRTLLNSEYEEALNYSDDELLSIIKRVNAAYSGKASLFDGKLDVGSLNTIIDKMTLPETSPMWSDYFSQITSGDTIYIGKLLDDKSNRGVREVTLSGELADSIVPVNETYVVRELSLSKLRSSMGFNRAELQECAVLPTTLMRNLAVSNNVEHAPVARAYLFSLVIDMLQCKNDLESGVLFSDSLQSALQLFKQLQRDLESRNFLLGSSCWLRRRPKEVDDLVIKFFEQIRNFDYDTEVTNTLKNIVNAKVQLAGYFDKDGQFVPIGNNESKELYIIEKGKFVRFHGGNGAPFAPLFVIDAE